MRKNLLLPFLVLVLLLGMLTINLPYITGEAYADTPRVYKDWEDAPEYWTDGKPDPVWKSWLSDNEKAKEEVLQAVAWEIYVGYDVKKPTYTEHWLRLSNKITRAEFATALARVLDVGKDGTGTEWYADRRDALIDAGVVPDASGNWNAPITRAEMAVWMGRAVDKFNADIVKDNVSFTDTDDPDIIMAAKAGVIEGYPDGTFRPEGGAQRVHAALMLVRLVKGFNDDVPTMDEINKIMDNFEEWANNINLEYDETREWNTEKRSVLLTERRFASLTRDWAGRGGRTWHKCWVIERNPVEVHNNYLIVHGFYHREDYPDSYKGLEGKTYFIKKDGNWLMSY